MRDNQWGFVEGRDFEIIPLDNTPTPTVSGWLKTWSDFSIGQEPDLSGFAISKFEVVSHKRGADVVLYQKCMETPVLSMTHRSRRIANRIGRQLLGMVMIPSVPKLPEVDVELNATVEFTIEFKGEFPRPTPMGFKIGGMPCSVQKS